MDEAGDALPHGVMVSRAVAGKPSISRASTSSFAINQWPEVSSTR